MRFVDVLMVIKSRETHCGLVLGALLDVKLCSFMCQAETLAIDSGHSGSLLPNESAHIFCGDELL